MNKPINNLKHIVHLIEINIYKKYYAFKMYNKFNNYNIFKTLI